MQCCSIHELEFHFHWWIVRFASCSIQPVHTYIYMIYLLYSNVRQSYNNIWFIYNVRTIQQTATNTYFTMHLHRLELMQTENVTHAEQCNSWNGVLVSLLVISNAIQIWRPCPASHLTVVLGFLAPFALCTMQSLRWSETAEPPVSSNCNCKVWTRLETLKQQPYMYHIMKLYMYHIMKPHFAWNVTKMHY